MKKGDLVICPSGETGYFIEDKGQGTVKVLVHVDGGPEYEYIPKSNVRAGGAPSPELQKYYGYLDNIVARERR